ncbi:MAG: hypothetical protein HY842_15990 [Bacteroidetes bacterium]|nr:hypothetical protein [Bacteroidota bacterium]
MKSKIVLWGSNAQDEKLLIAVSLRAVDNKVDIWSFPESVATEDFYQQMMKEWRDGEGMELPEPNNHAERELTLTEGLLPDDLKVERGDVVQRAQTEWHFIVLSSKLHDAYENQVNELKEKVEKLKEFDQATWDNLKGFWQKVQEQVRERNLFRDHADKLRDNTNVLFVQMKGLRSKMDEAFEKISKEAYDKFLEAFAAVEKKMESGVRVPVLFDELKKLQNKFREANLTREHRNKVWDKLNGAFKAVKEKRFGNKPGASGGGGDDSGSMLQRLQRRYDGLVSAIERMEQSIGRDRNDLDYQRHKIDTTDGQLEAQIRQAKLLMIEERARSKDEKLNEMNATKVDLEKRLASLKDKEHRRVAQEAAKEKIAGEIKAAAEAREDVAEKLEKAAEEIVAAKPAPKAKAKAKKGDSTVAAAISTALGESLEDFTDTVKAVASVIGDKIEDAIEEFKDDFKEITETAAAASATEEPAPVPQEETAAPAAEAATPVEEAEPVADAPAPQEEAPAPAAEETETPVEEEVAATENSDEKE